MSKPNSFIPDEVYGLNNKVHFGKHKNSYIHQIISRDPKWLEWAVEESVINLSAEANKQLELALELQDDHAGDWGDWSDMH